MTTEQWNLVVAALIVVFGTAGLLWYSREATHQERWRAYWQRRDRGGRA